MGVAFDDDIPKRGPELFIKRMKAGESRCFTVVGSRIRGIWVHWNPQGNCTEPHMEDNCNGCAKQMAKRWKGFLHCFDDAAHQEMFLELTPTGASAVQSSILSAEHMRGTVMTVTRGSKANSRLGITVQAYRRDPKVLPLEKDPRLSILKLWGVNGEQGDLDLGGDLGGGELPPGG